MDDIQLLRNQLDTAVALLSAIAEELEAEGEVASPQLIAKILGTFVAQAEVVLAATDT